MHWDAIEVKAEENLTLSVRFADGASGRVRFMPQHLTGVFEPLNDTKFFAQVLINNGVVTRPNELDLAPDAMYREIKEHGEWVLQ